MLGVLVASSKCTKRREGRCQHWIAVRLLCHCMVIHGQCRLWQTNEVPFMVETNALAKEVTIYLVLMGWKMIVLVEVK